MITFLDMLLQSTALKSSGPARIDYLFVNVRVMIRVKVRVLKIRNNDIRNQKSKAKQKNNPALSIPLFLRSNTFGCTFILCDPFLHFTLFRISFNLLILYDYVAVA